MSMIQSQTEQEKASKVRLSLSYSDIVPDDIQNRLHFIGQALKEGMFEIGDITNYLYDSAKNTYATITKEQIQSAVGSFCGKAARTIRDYATIAAFYDVSTRLKYDVLSFDHFRFAARFSESWQEILDWAILQTDTLNRPATVDDCIRKFAFEDEGFDEREEMDDLDDYQTLLSNARRTIQRASDMISGISDLKNKEEVRQHLSRAMSLLE